MRGITRISIAFVLGKTRTVDAWLHYRHLRSATFRSGNQATGRSAHGSTELSQFSTSGPWNVGDSATLLHDGNYACGVIQEARGRGWFTFQHSETNTTVKCRSSQLRRTQKTVVDHSRHNDPLIIKLNDFDDLLVDNISRKKKSEEIQQLAYFSSFREWLVFSDLHCSPTTLDTALQVLQHVHNAARNRSAGIIFLGDFFHHRSTLSVDMLNAVLRELRTFTQPMILIPGNHDQTRLSGENHALIPLQNAYRLVVATEEDVSVPGLLVLSYPTTFMRALFIPHLKQLESIKGVLQRYNESKHSAIFCHVDVSGASMNDNIVSQSGISASYFPVSATTYTGHYHKPHTVRNTNIHYVGSPYQVSLNEAQQEKAFYVLDATQNWTCVAKVPVSIGRKHFRPANVSEFLSLSTATNDHPIATLRAGDRVVFSIAQQKLEQLRRDQIETLDGSILDKHASVLRQAGVQVEIREVPDLRNMTSTNIEDRNDMSCASIWSAFLDEQECRGGFANETCKKELLQEGLEIIKYLDQNETEKLSEIWVDFQVHSVTLRGFGPFRSQQHYPLLNRGMVLLRGSNEDGGADSNGCGKTTLAMAVLWALTGTQDARPMADGKVSDVIHDSSKAAEVTIEGTTNGKLFSICRIKTASQGRLIFMLDGTDQTTQSIRETQELINEKLGVSPQLLARTMFHGQHSINNLLEATDAKLKEELSLLVSLNRWQSAVKHTREQARLATKRVSEIEGMLALRMSDLVRLKERLEASASKLVQKEKMSRETLTRLTDEMKFVSSELSKSNQFNISELETVLFQTQRRILNLQNCIQQHSDCHGREVADLRAWADECDSEVLDAKAAFDDFNHQKREQNTTVALATSKLLALEKLWKIDTSTPDLLNTFKFPIHCPTCHQSISADNSSFCKETTSIIRDIQKARAEQMDAEIKFENVVREVQLSSILVEKANVGAAKARKILNERCRRQTIFIGELREKLLIALESQRNLSFAVATAAKQAEGALKRELLRSQVEVEEDSLDHLKTVVESLRSEVADMEIIVRELCSEKVKLMQCVKLMNELSDGFGQRGIQTFVLQNAVSMLGAVSQSYLDKLSDGTQKMHLSTDSTDRILKRAFVRIGNDHFKERPLAMLSGGQWRRCSLALSLGFADLASQFGKFKSSFCVMDEPLTHLDRTGRAAVGRVLRSLIRRTHETEPTSTAGYHVSTLIIVLQDLVAEELEESFDCTDEVIKREGQSIVLVDN